jgi:uncharacterized protein YbjT (DUF2867 family)
VVGTERLTQSGYFRAKLAQEELIKQSSIPYSIVHAALIQPVATDDIASALGGIAVGSPVNGIVEIPAR